MTITRAQLGTLVDTGNGTAFDTGTAGNGTASGAQDGSANQLIIAYVIVSDSNDADPSAITIVNSPWGISSWTPLQDDIYISGTNRYRVAAFAGTTGGSDPGSDTFDISVAAGTGSQTGCAIYVSGYTDDSGSAPTVAQSNIDSSGATTTPVIDTLSALGSASWVEGMFVILRNPPAITADGGWTEAFDNGFSAPAVGLAILHSNGVTSDASPSGSWSSGTLLGAIGVEIAEPAGGGAVDLTADPANGVGAGLAGLVERAFDFTSVDSDGIGQGLAGAILRARALDAGTADGVGDGGVGLLTRMFDFGAGTGAGVGSTAAGVLSRVFDLITDTSVGIGQGQAAALSNLIVLVAEASVGIGQGQTGTLFRAFELVTVGADGVGEGGAALLATGEVFLLADPAAGEGSTVPEALLITRGLNAVESEGIGNAPEVFLIVTEEEEIRIFKRGNGDIYWGLGTGPGVAG